MWAAPSGGADVDHSASNDLTKEISHRSVQQLRYQLVPHGVKWTAKSSHQNVYVAWGHFYHSCGAHGGPHTFTWNLGIELRLPGSGS